MPVRCPDILEHINQSNIDHVDRLAQRARTLQDRKEVATLTSDEAHELYLVTCSLEIFFEGSPEAL